MDAAYYRILQKYHLSPDAQLSTGMEAEVYAYELDTVLKLYPAPMSFANFHILQDFYNSLDRQRVPYALPHIRTVAQEDSFVVTVEQRLAGTPMSVVLPACTSDQLDAMMQRYLTAALAISHIQLPSAFDPDRLSQRTSGDWHQFLIRYLKHKLVQVSPYLNRDVLQFATKVQHIQTILDQPYRGDYQLIHGDFFPGNLLLNDDQEITSLLDFGLLTMYGDALFDIATGWVFFDMYDELKAQVRQRYLAMLLERLGVQVRGLLYRYVLIYSMLSANTYSSQCSDGHYQWCVANLNNQDYWHAIE